MKKIEVLYNDCIGGYHLSESAQQELLKKYPDIDLDLRHDPRIVELFKEKGSAYLSSEFSKIEIKEVEADGYTIEDLKGGKERVKACYMDFIFV